MLERQPLGDASRRAARDRHGVEVTEQVEGDQPAVGRDVDVHPAALVDMQGHLARLQSARLHDVPDRRLGGRFRCGSRGIGGHGDRDRGCGDGLGRRGGVGAGRRGGGRGRLILGCLGLFDGLGGRWRRGLCGQFGGDEAKCDGGQCAVLHGVEIPPCAAGSNRLIAIVTRKFLLSGRFSSCRRRSALYRSRT